MQNPTCNRGSDHQLDRLSIQPAWPANAQITPLGSHERETTHARIIGEVEAAVAARVLAALRELLPGPSPD